MKYLLYQLWDQAIKYPSKLLLALIALLVTSITTLALGQGLKFLIDNGFGEKNSDILLLAVVVIVALAAVISFGTFVRFYSVSWLGERISANIRVETFKKLSIQTPDFFERNLSGELMTRITSDTAILEVLIGSSLSMALRNIVIVLGGLLMMIITSPKLTILILLIVPIVLIPIMILGTKVKRLSRQSQDRLADIGQNAGEIINEIKTVQAFNKVNEVNEIFTKNVEKAFNIACARIMQRGILISLVILLVVSSLGLVIWVGGQELLSGSISGGKLTAFAFYTILVGGGTATIAEVITELQRAAGAMERLNEIKELKPRIADSKQNVNGFNPNLSIKFRNISFKYPSQPKNQVLEGLQLQIDPNTTVAFVGRSGSGKSTIFELLLRFHLPDSGEIIWGNVPIQSMPFQQLRQKIAWVPQQPNLFSASIEDNIKFSSPQANQKDVINASETAFANEFIEQLPQKYQTFIGDRGIRLSGGQRQRLAIARALLAKPKLLLLDEATSALDNQSENQIQKALTNLKGTITTVIIAHRLSTIEAADNIYVIDKGRVIDSGSHHDLLEHSSSYQDLSKKGFVD